MDIGHVITILREKRKISQSELASLIDLTQPSLSNIESGKKKPRKATIAKICEALEIPEQFLYFLTIEEQDLPASGRQRYRSVGNDLKNIILSSLEK